MNHIHPDNLKDHWEFIRKGLEQVIKKGGSDGWIPEDVYLALKVGRSHLYLGDRAFLVVTPTDGFNGKKLFVWAAYSEIHGGIEKYRPFVRDLAKQIGASRYEFQSMRDYSKLFSQGMTTYYEDVI